MKENHTRISLENPISYYCTVLYKNMSKMKNIDYCMKMILFFIFGKLHSFVVLCDISKIVYMLIYDQSRFLQGTWYFFQDVELDMFQRTDFHACLVYQEGGGENVDICVAAKTTRGIFYILRDILKSTILNQFYLIIRFQCSIWNYERCIFNCVTTLW